MPCVPGLPTGASQRGLRPQLLPALHLRVLRQVGQRARRPVRMSAVPRALLAGGLPAQPAASQPSGWRAAAGAGRGVDQGAVRAPRPGAELLLRGRSDGAVLGVRHRTRAQGPPHRTAAGGCPAPPGEPRSAGGRRSSIL